MIEFVGLPAQLSIAWEPVVERCDDLLGDEANYARNMIAHRRHEFAAGRRAARAALSAVGVSPQPILRCDDRTPQWPTGLRGSITHADHIAGAVVGPVRDFAGIGLDVERADRVTDEVAERICTTHEWNGLQSLTDPLRRQAAALTFAVKECVHKAWHPLSGITLPFEAVEVKASATGRFNVRLLDPRLSAHGAWRWEGYWAESEGAVAALLTLS